MDKSSLTMTTGGDRQEAAGGLTQCATEQSEDGNRGSDPSKRRKGSSVATERKQPSDGKEAAMEQREAAYSLRCTTGD